MATEKSKTSKKDNTLHYRGRPMVRSGKTIYYGDLSEKYVACLQILTFKEVKDMEIADKVAVQILLTDDSLRPKDRILKKTEKNGLYEALDIASIWLDRSLAK